MMSATQLAQISRPLIRHSRHHANSARGVRPARAIALSNPVTSSKPQSAIARVSQTRARLVLLCKSIAITQLAPARAANQVPALVDATRAAGRTPSLRGTAHGARGDMRDPGRACSRARGLGCDKG